MRPHPGRLFSFSGPFLCPSGLYSLEGQRPLSTPLAAVSLPVQPGFLKALMDQGGTAPPVNTLGGHRHVTAVGPVPRGCPVHPTPTPVPAGSQPPSPGPPPPERTPSCQLPRASVSAAIVAGTVPGRGPNWPPRGTPVERNTGSVIVQTGQKHRGSARGPTSARHLSHTVSPHTKAPLVLCCHHHHHLEGAGVTGTESARVCALRV